MIKTRVFEVLEQRGQKQRWLLAELERRGYRVSEGYLSQIKAGTKQPGRRFVDAVCDAMGMSERVLFYSEGESEAMPKNETPKNGKQPSKPRASARSISKREREKGKINVAIDIDENKVGHDLSEAIFTAPNNTYKFSDVPRQDVRVSRGMTHDGLGKYLSEVITKAKGPTTDIVRLLKETQNDVVVSYLPVGSEEA